MYVCVIVSLDHCFQEKAALLFQNMSSSLLHMDLNNTEDNKKEIHTTASVIVTGVSNIMDHSSDVSH